MTTKDERIGIRVPSETKHSLLQIARKEGRSLSQVCEIFLRAEIHSYEKKGTKYLHRFIPENRGKNARRHGLLSREIVLTSDEESSEYAQLLADLREEHEPVPSGL